MDWAPPRNRQKKGRDWEEASEREGSEWRLEPEGEAEVPEIIVVSDAVEGTFVDLEGERSREHGEAKLSRRGREAPNEEIKSLKRESDSGGIRGNTGLCERSKEYGA